MSVDAGGTFILLHVDVESLQELQKVEKRSISWAASMLVLCLSGLSSGSITGALLA